MRWITPRQRAAFFLALYQVIEKEREGNCVDPDLLRFCVNVFPIMGLSPSVHRQATIENFVGL